MKKPKLFIKRDNKMDSKINYSLPNMKTIIVAILTTSLLLILPVYYFSVYESVDVTEYALKVNWLDKKLDESTVYEEGLYDIGFYYNFIKFPRTVQEITYFVPEESNYRASNRLPLDSRTKDGLLITFQLSFYFQLQKENLTKLYKTYALTYEDKFIGQGRTTLRDVASYYNAIEFFNNRTIIGHEMEIELAKALGPMYTTVVNLQLREIDLPNTFEDALERVQVAQQEYEVAKYEQQAAIVRAETKIFESRAQANITIITAEADAEAFLINMEAQATALNITLATQNLAYYAMAQQLNLTSTELLSLLWIMAIMNHDDSLLIIGENTPVILPVTNSTNLN